VFLSPDDVRDQKLKRRMRGYNRDDVEGLLEQVVASYEQVWRERDELRAKVTGLEQELAPMRESEEHLRNTLVTAERSAAEVRAEAERKAEELLEQARKEVREHQAAVEREHSRLNAEIRRLELVERELHASLRAFLLAGLELVEDHEPTSEASVVEVPTAALDTIDSPERAPA
jgi:cell division initiation protein